MKLSYDRDEDILTIELIAEGVIDHAEHTGPFSLISARMDGCCCWKSSTPASFCRR